MIDISPSESYIEINKNRMYFFSWTKKKTHPKTILTIVKSIVTTVTMISTTIKMRCIFIYTNETIVTKVTIVCVRVDASQEQNMRDLL